MPARTIEAVPSRGSALPTPPGGSRFRRPLLVALAVAVPLVILVLATTRSGGGGGHKASASKVTGSAAAGGAQASAGDTPRTAAASAATSSENVAKGKKLLPGGGGVTEIPLDVRVSNTKGLRDGDLVRIHATPKSGYLVYGFEAFLCKGGASYVYDADMRPTETGKCAATPLSPNADQYVQMAAQPPYTSVDGTFRVGVGSERFQTNDGRTATVTCGPRDPCNIVLKLQFTNGYGLQAVPVTFR